MADSYWGYGGDALQHPAAIAPQPQVVKRPRSEFEMPNNPEFPGYYPPEDNNSGLRPIRDTEFINESYDRYLLNAVQQMSSFNNDDGRSISSGILRHDEPLLKTPIKGPGPEAAEKARPVSSMARPEIQLPPDASSTLYVEGLPANCTRREVSHIFRPFVGYKEVRLINKESRNPGADPRQLIFSFVDFESPAHAATAMDALQGYKFDEHDRESPVLRFQFARHTANRSGSRGKR